MEVLRVEKEKRNNNNETKTIGGVKDPLSQNGRAQPLSSVLMGRYNEKWSFNTLEEYMLIALLLFVEKDLLNIMILMVVS